jgi:transcriptional regulator of heat shock response
MVLTKNEVSERRDRVLGVTIEEYIRSVAPVSSSLIVEKYFSFLSSATVRNILNELEAEGFLTHPHTSAGRIPTQKGYRYYVDYLMNEIQLLEEEKQRIKEEYEQETRELEILLDKTSEILSVATHYTSIVSIDGTGNKLFCRGRNFVVTYPEYQNLEKIQSILETLEEKDRLLNLINRDLQKKIDIYIGHETALSQIDSCSLVVSQYRTHHGPTGRIAVLGPTRMDYERVVSAVDYVTDLMEEIW